jgi:hypothetical protein
MNKASVNVKRFGTLAVVCQLREIVEYQITLGGPNLHPGMRHRQTQAARHEQLASSAV